MTGRRKRKKIPTVVLDIDDTIVDFTGFLCYLYNMKHGTTVTEADLTSWNFYDTKVEDAQGNIVKGEELRKFFKSYEKNGLYAALPPIKESVLAMELMRKLGYTIILLTARDEKFKKDTEINLVLNKVPYDDVVFNAEKDKQINRLARKHAISIFVDDNFEHVDKVLETDKVEACYLINKTHNREQEINEEVFRVNDLLEVVRQLSEAT